MERRCSSSWWGGTLLWDIIPFSQVSGIVVANSITYWSSNAFRAGCLESSRSLHKNRDERTTWHLVRDLTYPATADITGLVHSVNRSIRFFKVNLPLGWVVFGFLNSRSKEWTRYMGQTGTWKTPETQEESSLPCRLYVMYSVELEGVTLHLGAARALLLGLIFSSPQLPR